MSSERAYAAEIAGIRDSLAALGDPWRCGETHLSGLARDSRKGWLGVPPPAEGELAARVDLPGRMAESAVAAMGADVPDGHPPTPYLPRAFDLRDVSGRNYVTGVKDQGSSGACSAFATVAALETTAAYTRSAPGLTLDLSEAHLYYGHAAAREAITPDGTWPDEMFEDCVSDGITFEDYYPFAVNQAGAATTALRPGWRGRLAKAANVVDLSRDPAAIKRHLYGYGAVAACLVVYADFFHYTGGVYRHTTEETAGGHAVALIGWDDDAGCWLAKNSWGRDWGEDGFLRIAYGEAYIEDYPDPRATTIGCSGVQLRAWLPAQRPLALRATAGDPNGWVYLENLGWTRLAGGPDGTTGTVAALLSARGNGRTTTPFIDDELGGVRLAGDAGSPHPTIGRDRTMTERTATTEPAGEAEENPTVDSRPPEPPTGWDPYAPPRPAGWDPYAPPRPAGWDPYAPPRPAGWDPYAPPRPAGWDPYAPPRPMGWDPYAPPRPAGWDPYAPPRPAGWDPYAPPPVVPVPTGWDPYSQPNTVAQPANGITNGAAAADWVNQRAITHLWSGGESPGVWVAVHGAGWKQLLPESGDAGNSHLTQLALLAKTYRLPVSYHENSLGQIDQIVV